MKDRITLVIASRNQKKTAEIIEILKDFPVQVKNLDDFGPLPPVIEDGETFEANAFKKASQTARMLGCPALADDSGLVVPALQGAPGVHSARYAGERATDQERCRKLLEAMEGQTDRRAAFECVISVAVPTGQALTYEGRCEGEIAGQPAGEKGFGYDPIFYFPPFEKTFAQLEPAEKNGVSHRGKALQELKSEFDKVLVWIDMHLPVFARQGCQGEGS